MQGQFSKAGVPCEGLHVEQGERVTMEEQQR